jgi:hypothetical protein
MQLRHTMFEFDASQPFGNFHEQFNRALRFQNRLEFFSVSAPQWHHILVHPDVRKYVDIFDPRPADALGKMFNVAVREVTNSHSWPSHLCMVSYYPRDPHALANAVEFLERQVNVYENS